MTLEIGPLTKQDLPGAVECVQKAFADDPYFLWQFDASKVRTTFFPLLTDTSHHVPLWIRSIDLP
jgi:hypothetical protein